MTPEEFDSVQQSFLELRELPAESRERQLEALRSTVPEIAAAVESMLAASNDESDRFLERPLVELDREDFIETKDLKDANSIDAEIPKQIGDYRILQRIGEGGYGVVFMAEQTEPIRRRVAIKWVKPGMDSKMVLARFEAERQALAMMNHPSIANVIDAGRTDSGQNYFVMELVHGIPIQEFCEENQLELDERLRLFQQVCAAVHHAHRKGIIHRDIKPANVLVTIESGKPLAKVIDFGIAKALHMPLTEKTMYTEYGQIIGTLEYMSPEQALMSQTGIDVRSDVYSLGVLLYLLITGETPLSKNQLLKQGIWELRNVLQTSQPENPSLRITNQSGAGRWRDLNHSPVNWLNRVKGDLDWVTMKALAKEPDQRYDSAAQLSDDLESYLSSDAVIARPPTFAYRFSKFISRNRVSAAITCAICLGVVTALVGMTWGFAQSQKNVKALKKANALVIEKAESLENERNRADENASRMATLLQRSFFEDAWVAAVDGDLEKSQSILADVPKNAPTFPSEFIYAVGRQMQLQILRDDERGVIRKLIVHEEIPKIGLITTDSRLEIWHPAQREPQQCCQLTKSIYSAACFDSGGSQVLLGAGGQLSLFDLDSESVKRTQSPGRGGIRDILFDEGNNRWHVTTGANFVLSLDATSLKIESSQKLDTRISKIAIVPGNPLVVTSLDGDLIFLDSSSLEPVRRVSGLKDEVADYQWLDNRLLTVDWQGGVFETGGDSAAEQRAKLNFEFADSPIAVDISPDGSVVGSWRDGRIGYLDSNSLRFLILRKLSQASRFVSFLPGSGQILLAHPSGRIDLIQPAEIEQAESFPVVLQDLSDGVSLFERPVSISGHKDGTLKMWDRDTGVLLKSNALHSREIFEIDVHEPTSRIASVGADGRIIISNMNSLRQESELLCSWGVRCLAFSPNGELLAGAPASSNKNQNREGTLDLWNVQSGQPETRLTGHTNWVTEVRFLNNGKNMVSLSVDGTARYWDCLTGNCLITIDLSSASPPRSIAVSENRDLFVGHDDGSISQWSLVNGEQQSMVQVLPDAIDGLCVPNQQSALIATSSSQSELLMLDLKTLEPLAAFDARIGNIRGARMDGTGRQIQLIGESGVVRIWPFRL